MPSNSYDLVVLGDDLAALVCATLCARRGLRTLVLGDDRPARYLLGPHKLPVEPMMWPGLPGSAAERILKELHAELALRRKLREPKLSAQLVCPDLRVDLGAERLAAELERELGATAGNGFEEPLAFWTRAADVARTFDPLVTADHAYPGVGFFEKREVAKLVERATAEADAWRGTVPSGGVPFIHLAAILARHPSPSAIAEARALDQWRAGPSPLRGDGEAVREILVEKLTTAGGEVRAGRVAELGVSWGKLSSLTLANGDDIGCGQIVASRTPAELAALLGKKAPKRLSELSAEVSLVGYRYTLNVVLDEAGVPEHMAPTVAVIAAADADPTGDAAFTIHLGEPDDAGRVVATIAAVLPADGPLDADRIGPRCMALRAGLWRRLADVMPFFERHLVLAHSPFEATPPQVPGGRGSYDVPRNLPLTPPPIWRGSTGYLTGLKNLTLVGDQVIPDMGIEGALTSGWSAAKIACAIAGKKKDYLRDEVVGAAS
ncbi:MAG TPA: hypothetical protein VGM88_33520 [Kofleriaceae bacterium]|jgi:phytoene dehydrogenase-like protein